MHGLGQSFNGRSFSIIATSTRLGGCGRPCRFGPLQNRHFSVSTAASPRAYRATKSLCFYRPCRHHSPRHAEPAAVARLGQRWIKRPSPEHLAVRQQGLESVTKAGSYRPCSVQRLRFPSDPYPSTCQMVQRLTSRRSASSRWLTPFARSNRMYSRCCPVKLGRRLGKRPSTRALA